MIQNKQISPSPQPPISNMDKIISDGKIRISAFRKLGEFLGHMSQCGTPQYITRQLQSKLHKAAQNSPELDGLSNAEKENAMKHNEQEMNKQHNEQELWSIARMLFDLFLVL